MLLEVIQGEILLLPGPSLLPSSEQNLASELDRNDPRNNQDKWFIGRPEQPLVPNLE